MNLGRVVGTVVATQKDSSLMGVNLKLLQPLDEKLSPVGSIIAAADPMGARPDDIVMWVGAREASLALENKFAPVDAAIVGFVDRIGAQTMEADNTGGRA